MVDRVNPPPHVSMPRKLSSDPELGPYFQQIGRILFQLWSRVGGGGDDQIDFVHKLLLGNSDSAARIASLSRQLGDLELKTLASKRTAPKDDPLPLLMSLRSSIAGLRASSQRLESVVAGRNKVINGNFAINQVEVSGTVSLASGEYGHDGWKAGASGCTYTFAESEGVTTLTMTAGSLIQVVEGANLFSGPHVLSWEGTAQGKIGAGSYADSGVGASVTGGADLEIEFGTGTLAKVQFEPGQYRTVFEHLHPQTDLERCQRYYWRCQFPDVNFGSYASGAYFTARLFFPSSMRATPTMNYSMTGTASNCSISSVGSASPQGARLLLQSSAISTNCYVQANAGDYIEADARL